MSVRRLGALLLAGALATGLAACGDDGDGDDDVALEDVVDEAEDESEDSEDTEESDEGDDRDVLEGVFDSERCQDLFGALSGLGAAFGEGGTGFDFGDFADGFEALADEAPEIEGELGVLADAYREFDEALGDDVDFSDPETFTSQDLLEASEAFQSSEVVDAQTAVTEFLDSECTSG
jgi:hypothetical protein